MSFHSGGIATRPRKRCSHPEGSYHGQTLGALAVGNVELYREIYQPLLMDVLSAPSPDCYMREDGESWERTAGALSPQWTRSWPGTRTRSAPSSWSRWCNAPRGCACITRFISSCCAPPATGTAYT